MKKESDKNKLLRLIARAKRESYSILNLADFSDKELPDEISGLQDVKEIHISGCRNLISLPDSIKNLRNLQKLTLVHTGLNSLPESIGALESLTYFRIHSTPLTELPASIGNLCTLKTLKIIDCRLVSLPDSIGDLSLLVDLMVSGNHLRNIPDSINGLKNLQNFHASGNWLQSLPDSICKLTSLRSLVLNGNYLKALPAQIGMLANLKLLNVSNNKLYSFPDSLRGLPKLDKFKVLGNYSLGLPAEVLGAEPEKIFDFFFRSSKRRRLNEAKILLVGQGGVGKTSLVNRLLDGSFDEHEAKTDGIRVRDWSVGNEEKIILNVWDFGGQEIMHATHQFFLTKRSLYILVLDARAGERESNIHYWLEMISIYGAHSPVIVVLNKSEEHYEKLDEHRLHLDYGSHVNFAGFHNISCKTGYGIKELKHQIENAVRSMPHVSDYLPEDYFAVKEQMEILAKNTDFITEEEYAAACTANGVVAQDEQMRLLRFLHDLGCVLHYDDPDQRYHVHDTRVLNPAWVTGGVYQILNDSQILRKGDGIVQRSDLMRLLDAKRYPTHRYRFLIEIMKKYDLCIEIPDDAGKVLVPELLSKNEPDVGWLQVGSRDVLDFQYHYTVLPRGLVPRFIVRTQHLLTQLQTLWRAGTVLSIEECRVLVRGDIRTSKVFIQIQGPSKNRRRALSVIRDAFSAVHKSYGDLGAEEKIPLPRDPEAPPIDYRHLIKLELSNVEEYLFEKAQRPYNIRELLDGIDERRFDAFLSHHSIDKPAVREVSRLLTELGVRCWLDEQQLKPGQQWQEELATALRECRVILVLIGKQGIGPWEQEETAISLHKAARGKKKVIPVLLPHSPEPDQLPAQYDFLVNRTWVDFRSGFLPGVVRLLADSIKQ